jgi:glutamate-1-semialdehyde 2,1-aminomutase
MFTKRDSSSHLVGDVMSAWNAFRYTGPIKVARAHGCRVWAEDGREMLDWIMGWGSLLLGHTPSFANVAMREAEESGFGFQYETSDNERLAARLASLIPGAERTRFANSGTEATLHALRVARFVTGRRKILKFEGHFHGLNDYLLFGVDGGTRLGESMDGGTIEPVSGSRGLPEDALKDLIVVVPFNDVSAVERAFELNRGELAAVIAEPVSLNIGCVYPQPGFLEFLREKCDAEGSLLIFDEILTNFRLGPSGAQGAFGVTPDLTCLGKALGCGFPVAALCGLSSHMDVLSPVGGVEMAGTNTGRRLSILGALHAIEAMVAQEAWRQVQVLQDIFVDGAREIFARHGVPAHVQGAGGRIGVHIGLDRQPENFRDIARAWNRDYHVKCYMACVDADLFGFLLPLGPCPEPVTLSTAHTAADIHETLNRLESILKALPYAR